MIMDQDTIDWHDFLTAAHIPRKLHNHLAEVFLGKCMTVGMLREEYVTSSNINDVASYVKAALKSVAEKNESLDQATQDLLSKSIINHVKRTAVIVDETNSRSRRPSPENEPSAKRAANIVQPISTIYKREKPSKDKGSWIYHINKQTSFNCIKEWIFSNLVNKINLGETVFNNIVESSIGDELDDRFYDNFTGDDNKPTPPFSLVSQVASAIVCDPIFSAKSEYENCGLYDRLILQIIKEFLPAIKHLDQTRDQKEKYTDFTIAKKRPDYLLCINNMLVLRAEEKTEATGSIEQAEKELDEKLGPMDDEFYGNIPFLFGYVASGNQFRMKVFPRDPRLFGQSITLFDLDLDMAADRASLIVKLIKMLILFEQYGKLRVRKSWPFKLYQWTSIGRPDPSAEFYFSHNFVEKYIITLPKYVNYDHLIKIYQVLAEPANAEDLVGGRENVIRKIGDIVKESNSQRFKVRLAPFCYHQQTINTVSEFTRCLKHVAHGLVFLHSSGIIHRDLRWSNIVYDTISSNYILIDFEHAAFVQPGGRSQAPAVGQDFRACLSDLPIKLTTRVFQYTHAIEISSFGLLARKAIDEQIFTIAALINIDICNLPRIKDKAKPERILLELVISLTMKTRESDRPTAHQLYSLLDELQSIMESMETMTENERKQFDLMMPGEMQNLAEMTCQEITRRLKQLKDSI